MNTLRKAPVTTCCTMSSPLGDMLLVARDGALAGVYFAGQKYFPPHDPAWRVDADVPVLRAAGAATGRNPWSIVVPCHRVVGVGGALTGYAGGLDRKRALLALERRDLLTRAA